MKEVSQAQHKNWPIVLLLLLMYIIVAMSDNFGGILIEKFGYKSIISLGFILSMGSLVVLVTCKSFLVLIIGLSILNSGIAMFNVGVNTLGPAMNVASTAVLMNFVNFSYGTWNTAIQQVTGSLLSKACAGRPFIWLCCSAAPPCSSICCCCGFSINHKRVAEPIKKVAFSASKLQRCY